MSSRTSIYRQIRAQRTWRPLGKMSWWRVGVGIALLLFALLLSGVPSQRLAASGRFEAAERMIKGEALEYQVLREALEPGQT